MSDLLGGCQPYTFGDKVYQVAPRDIFIERQFSLWVMTEAALTLDRLRPSIPPLFYREQMEVYNSKIVGKLLDWGRTDCYNASTSDEGEKQLLYLKMKRGEAKGGQFINREDLDRFKKDKEQWDKLLLILYQQDYPEQYESFLALIKREDSSDKKTAPDGTPNNTGDTSHQQTPQQGNPSA